MPKSPFIPGDRVNAYIRDSGGEKQELSLDQQEAALRSWCDEHGLVLVHVFRDEARRGSSAIGRDGFQDMMHHFRSPACQEAGLVIWNYARFARDVDDAQFARADLRRRGYTFHSLNDEIPEGPMGRLFEAAIDWKNEQFLEDLSRDTRRGLHDLVLKYGAVPGTPPRGFKRVPVKIGQRRDKTDHVVHRWVPDPETIPLVQQAFRMKAAGSSLLEITRATGLYRSLNSYTTFYRNELYIGRLRFGDLVVENYCAPVIDDETWQVVQAQLKTARLHQHLTGDNRLHPRRRVSAWLLSGLVYCGECGSPLFGHSTRQRNGGYYETYRCTRAKRRRDCPARDIPRKTLDRAILEELHDYILSPEDMRRRDADRGRVDDERKQDLRRELAAQGKRLAGLRRQIANVADAIAERRHSRALLDKLARLEAYEAACLAEIGKLNASLEAQDRKFSEVEIDQLSAALREDIAGGDRTRMRAILQGITHRITVLREENAVRGLFEYYAPEPAPKKAKAPIEGASTVSIYRNILGAPVYRHSFTFPLKRQS